MRTVAGELENALSTLFDEPVKITAAGRTDAGVHATGQVISFASERVFPIDRLAYALNANVPDDLSARDAAIVADGFSARFDALARTYVYRILNRPLPSAVTARYAHHVWQPIGRGSPIPREALTLTGSVYGVDAARLVQCARTDRGAVLMRTSIHALGHAAAMVVSSNCVPASGTGSIGASARMVRDLWISSSSTSRSRR